MKWVLLFLISVHCSKSELRKVDEKLNLKEKAYQLLGPYTLFPLLPIEEQFDSADSKVEIENSEYGVLKIQMEAEEDFYLPVLRFIMTEVFPEVTYDDRKYLSKPYIKRDISEILYGKMNPKKEYIFYVKPGSYFASLDMNSRYGRSGDGRLRQYWIRKTEYISSMATFGFQYKFDKTSGDAVHQRYSGICQTQDEYFAGYTINSYTSCPAIHIKRNKITKLIIRKPQREISWISSFLQSTAGWILLYPIYGGFLGYNVRLDFALENDE